jgi:hypothetical protein
MADLGLDTIYWRFAKDIKMYYGGSYEITETKFNEYRLWDCRKMEQVGLYRGVDSAQQAAELHKQGLAITS